MRVAIADAVAEYGWTWYHGPQWPTSDQIVPWQEFWGWYRTIWARRAKERLNLAAAIGLALASSDDPAAQRMRDATLKEAFPGG